MLDWAEICLLFAAATMLISGFAPQLRSYRSLLLGSSVLVDDFTLVQVARSDVIGHVAEVFRGLEIQIGSQAVDVRLVRGSPQTAVAA